ncbi:type II secretion system minor pseudopilin GspH [Thaumasiovibrio subtropicus]|uniref:type II secretion system minor pseudopilin GspH n=1 Tax=Thaumasiovibrio subtropicus TaxID=1891207 RepID=UPI000B357433|nr:type II secretion system minor pseudopilin GspH [Thaumasiovibrio subtropicus]
MRSRSAGFTLIEVMLVVILMASIAMAAVVMIPQSQEDNVEEEARRMYQLTRLLGEQAVLTGTDFGIWVGREGYEFRRLTRDGWENIEDSAYFSRVEFEDQDLKLGVDMLGFSWEQRGTLFKPGSLFDEDMFRDEEEERKNDPQIVVMASGELTPFEITLEWSNTEPPWRLLGNEVGRLQLLAPGEEPEEDAP